jgi:hypothetical protein
MADARDPHYAHRHEPASPQAAGLISKVIASVLPWLLGELRRWRATADTDEPPGNRIG